MVITLAELARLALEHPDDLARPVAPLVVGGRRFDTDRHPVVMGVINLSVDSTYRESVATSTRSAIRRGRVLVAQGADLVDLGAESSSHAKRRVSPEDQVAGLVPVVEALAADDVLVSVEAYDLEVLRAGLRAGATMLNLSGSGHDDEVFTLAAEHAATVVLCHIGGTDSRTLDGGPVATDPLPGMLAGFEARLARARELGVEHVVVDPGTGFELPALARPHEKARHQSMVLLNSFRLRRLGVPVCHAMPHAFDLFEDQFRSAEGLFTLLAHLGGTGVYRTHEVPLVRAVLHAVEELDVNPGGPGAPVVAPVRPAAVPPTH